MLDPLSVAGVSIGAVSLSIQVLDGIFKGYRAFEGCLGMPDDCQYVSTCFVVEAENLRSWVTSVGLDKYTDEASVSASIKNTRLPLLAILTEMRTSITDFFVLNSKYSDIDISATQKEEAERGVVKITGEHLADTLDLLQAPWEPLPANKKPNIFKRGYKKAKGAGKDIKEVVVHPKRLLWVVFDKEKAETLIQKLQNLNRYLAELLDEHQMKILVETTHDSYIELVQMHNDVTSLKQLVEAINFNTAQTENPAHSADPSRLSPPRYNDQRKILDMVSGLAKFKELNVSMKHLPVNIVAKKIKPRNPSHDRTPATYTADGEPAVSVWVEWKQFQVTAVEGVPQPEPKILARIEQLAALLKAEKPPEFCIPPCMGFFQTVDEYSDNGHFGFVFTAPRKAPPGSKMHSLLTALGATEPSLTDRIALAGKLATCILYLHSVNWLHKGLRSDNVVSFSEQLDTRFKHPYLLGFEYARPDLEGEWTDPVHYVPEWELYRHPDYRGVQPARARKTFDIYSLGVILLEIASWKPINSMFPAEPEEALEDDGADDEEYFEDEEEKVDLEATADTSTQKPGRIQEAILNSESDMSKEIRSKVGNRFYEAIHACIGGCLSFKIDRLDFETDTETAIGLQKDFKRLVVDKLVDTVL